MIKINRIFKKWTIHILLLFLSFNYISCNIDKNQESYVQSVFSGFCLIFISELLDRTFFLTMIYALSNSFMKTFIISTTTLIFLNILAILLGSSMPLFFYKEFIDWIAVATFLFIGVLLLYDGINMIDVITYKQDFIKENENVLNNLEENLIEKEMKSQDSITQVKFDTTFSFVTSLVLAEVGDKSQVTGVLIGAVYNFYGVLLGTSLGFVMTNLLAIWFGNYLATKISKKQIKIISGIIFDKLSSTNFKYCIKYIRIYSS